MMVDDTSPLELSIPQVCFLQAKCQSWARGAVASVERSMVLGQRRWVAAR